MGGGEGKGQKSVRILLCVPTLLETIVVVFVKENGNRA